jgi:hypothetical protein
MSWRGGGEVAKLGTLELRVGSRVGVLFFVIREQDVDFVRQLQREIFAENFWHCPVKLMLESNAVLSWCAVSGAYVRQPECRGFVSCVWAFMYVRVLDVCSVVCLRALEVGGSSVEESYRICYQESAEAYFTIKGWRWLLCACRPFAVQCTNTAVQSVTAHSSSLHSKIAGVCALINVGHSERGNAGSDDNQKR